MQAEKPIQNRTPLQPIPFVALPLGDISPAGWLEDQLKIQAAGMTGHLPDHWGDLGPDSGWLGGVGESWERGPYYLDGLLPLAYLLKDETLIEQSQKWVEWTLNSQQANGQFGPTVNDDWWSRMVMLKVLTQYAEATGDDRVIPFLTKYFRFQHQGLRTRPLRDWGQARGAENILVAQWLYNRTGESFLLDLMQLIHEQTLDWTELLTNFPFWRYQTEFNHRTHVVNVAMGVKAPAIYYQVSGAERHKHAPFKGIRSLMTHHGQAHGMFSGDEWLAGTHPSQGVELCAVVEYMFSLEHLLRILGDGEYGDILEKVAFNALPATISPDWNGHQYDQQVNQIMCTVGKRNWTSNHDDSNIFGLEPNFGCCTANMHQGWPKFSTHLWMATADGGIAAMSYAPCIVRTHLSHDVPLTLTVQSDYPFRDQVGIVINVTQSAQFPIKLRIPSWCNTPVVKVNDQQVSISTERGFCSIDRRWEDGDRIQLKLPMEVQVHQRGNLAVSVQRGPLVYALPIKERWQRFIERSQFSDWEIYPESAWNYGLALQADRAEASFQVVEQTIATQPFQADFPPVVIRTWGRRLPTWYTSQNSAMGPPMSPVSSDETEEEIELIPYGSARLRIAEFPVIAESK